MIAAIAAFVAALGRPNNPDTLWHLALGRWIVIHRAMPDISQFYYSARGGFGFDYSWLSQVLLFGSYRVLGDAGVAILTALAAGLIFYFLYKLLEETSTNMLVNFAVLCIALVTVATYLSGRPVMFTVAFLALEIFVLSGYVRRRNRAVWLVPLFTALWVNLHPGFVIAPLMVLVFVPLADSARHRWVLVGTFAASLAAVLLNPYGWRMYLMPLEVARTSSLLKGLSEWASVSGWETIVWGGLVALLACALCLRRQPGMVILLAVLGALAAGISNRNMPLFGVIAVFVIGRALLPRVLPRLRRMAFVRRFDLEFEGTGGWFWALAVPALMAGAAALHVSPVDLRFDLSGYPETAVRYLKQSSSPDNVFVRETWSGYLLWTVPGRRLFYDAKGGFSRTAASDHKELVKPRAGWRGAAERNGIATFLLEPGSPLAVLLAEASDWRLGYSDSVAEVFVRRAADSGQAR